MNSSHFRKLLAKCNDKDSKTHFWKLVQYKLNSSKWYLGLDSSSVFSLKRLENKEPWYKAAPAQPSVRKLRKVKGLKAVEQRCSTISPDRVA